MAHLFTHGTRGEPTKQTPIGEMPVSWEVKTLGDVVKVAAGTVFKFRREAERLVTDVSDEQRRRRLRRSCATCSMWNLAKTANVGSSGSQTAIFLLRTVMAMQCTTCVGKSVLFWP